MSDARLSIEPRQVTLAIEGWNADNVGELSVFERSIESLRSQTFPLEGCQLLLLVGGPLSSEHGARLAASLPPVEIVSAADPSYYGMKNAALDRAGREILVFADSDVHYEPSWLRSLLAPFEHDVAIVVGNTRYEPGFLHRTLDLCDWAAARPSSGYTGWVYGNNLALRTHVFRNLRYRTDMGVSGVGGSDVLRMVLKRRGIRPWFSKGAVGYHRRDPFLVSRFRVGTYHVHNRQLAPELPGARLTRVPIFGPGLVTAGTMVRAWQRAWRSRSELPGGALSLPWFWLTITLAKSVELIGAMMRAWFPRWILRRGPWFVGIDASVARDRAPSS